MATEIALKATVELGEGAKSLKSLKEEFRNAQKELEGLTIGSEKYIQTLKKLGNTKDDINDLNTTIKAFNPEGKIGALSSTIGGVASGFQAATAATALFGSENKNLEKTLLKVQASMAFADGIKGVVAMGDAFKVLRLIILSNPIMLIGAVIAGVGLALYALKDKIAIIGKAFDLLTAGFRELIKNAEMFLEFVGLTDAAGDAMIKKAEDNARKRGEFEKQVREKTKEILAQRAKDKDEHDKKELEAYKKHQDKLKKADEDYLKWKANIDEQLYIGREQRDKERSEKEDKDKAAQLAKLTEATDDEQTEADVVSATNISRMLDEFAVESEIKEKGLETLRAGIVATQILTDAAFSIKMRNVKKGSAEEAKLAEKQFKINKAMQLSLAVIDGFKAINASLASSPLAIGVIPNPIGIANLAITAATTAANIAKIASSQFGGGGVGSVASVSAPSTGSVPTVNAPTQQTTQLSPTGQVLNPSEQTQPMRAYVVETEITGTQKNVGRIKQQATW